MKIISTNVTNTNMTIVKNRSGIIINESSVVIEFIYKYVYEILNKKAHMNGLWLYINTLVEHIHLEHYSS